MKHILKIVLSSIFFLVTSFSVRADDTQPLLVLDMRNAAQYPQYFRTSSDKLPSNINTTGLAELHVAGSGQFSKLALQKVLHRLPAKQVMIIDLRQESHGFLNGNAISWYAPANAINANKTVAQIEKDQDQLLNALSKNESVMTSNVEKTKTVEFSVHDVASEAELIVGKHIHYAHLYVQDYHAPSVEQANRFIQIVRKLPSGRWLYFHCRGGAGRTSTFMAMYDMLRNAKQVSFDDIIARQVALGGKDLTDIPPVSDPKHQAAVERLAFLHQFYQYAHDNNDGFQTALPQL